MGKCALVLVSATVFVFCVGGVEAQDKPVDGANPFSNSPPPSKPSAEPASGVRITAEDCARLVTHHPRDDVAYKPGVDVYGNPVASADVPSQYGNIKVPSNIEFDIGFNPLKGNAANRFGETSASVGRVAYDINSGRLTFNGQPLTDPDQARVARECEKRLQQVK